MPPPRRQLGGWEQPKGVSGAAAPPAKKARVEPNSVPPAAAGEKKALTFEDRVKEVAGDKADFSKDLLVLVTSTGGATCQDNVWEAAYLVPDCVLGDEKTVRPAGGWLSFNYSKEFERLNPKLFAAISDYEESPYYIGCLEAFPEMTTWVARTVLKDIVNVDGMNW